MAHPTDRPTEIPQKRIEPKRLKGFRDSLPAVMTEKLRLIAIIRDVARLAGFKEIQTPALEYAETLLGSGSEETDKQVYRFRDHGDRDIGLRFDLTVPFARFVSEHYGELTFPFKKLQIGEVWRGENTQRGRYREFCQCDLDIIGVDSIQSDLEILCCFSEIITRMNIGHVTFHVNSRPVLTGLIRTSLGPLSEDHERKVLISLDKLDKLSEIDVAKLIERDASCPIDSALRLVSILKSADQHQVGTLLKDDVHLVSEFNRLFKTIELASAQSTHKSTRFILNLSIARGLAYYTGIVFEAKIDAMPGFGSICSGGRYNDLVSRFSSQCLPGVGASIGLDRLISSLEEQKQNFLLDKCLCLLAVADEDSLDYAQEILWELRRSKIAAEIGLTAKLGNQFKYADRLGIPFVITVGSHEKSKQVFNLKDLKTGLEEKNLSREKIVQQLANHNQKLILN